MRVLKESFNAGEFTPRLYSRYELAKYKNGCKTLTNFLPTPHGPVTRRPGTEYIAEVADSDSFTRLIPFEFSEDDSYMLEFGPLTIRYYRNGAQLQTADAATVLLLHCDGANLSTTITDDSPTPHTCTAVGNSKITTSDKKFGTGSLQTAADGDYVSVPDHADFNFGSAAFTIDWWFQWDGVATSPTSIEFFSQTQSTPHADDIMYAFSNGTSAFQFRVESGGSTLHLANLNHDAFTADTWYHLALIRGWGGDVDTLALCVNGVMVETSDMTGVTIPDYTGTFNIGGLWIGGTWLSGGKKIDEFRVSKGSARWTENFTPPTRQYPDGDSSGVAYETTTTYTEEMLPDLDYVQSADVMYIVHKDVVPRSLSRSGHVNWAIANVSFTDAPAAWSAGDYPRTVEFFEDRLVFGGSPDQPDTIWTSHTSAYHTFTVGDASAEKAITLTLLARKVNDIQWLSSGRKLLAGTRGEEWWAAGPSDTEPMTPAAHVARKDSAWGSDRIKPANIGDVVFYVQQGGRTIRELIYNFQKDKYVSSDLNVLSEHLTRTYSITAMAYQQQPYQILWCVRSDGTLLALTYLKEHEIVAWSKHTSGSGEFESVAVIPGDPEDELWVVVKRTVNSATVRYIERFKKFKYGDNLADAFYVDSGLTYDGALAYRITDLSHIGGETVWLLADGVAGTSLYSSSTVGAAVASSTSLLLHFDGVNDSTVIPDSGGTTHVVTAVQSAACSTTQKKFGGSSIALGGFNANGYCDYLSLADHADWNFGSSAFTIDCWVYFNSMTDNHCIAMMSNDPFDGDYIFLFEVGDSAAHFSVSSNGSHGNVCDQTFAWTPVVETWYHIALIRGWGGSNNNIAVTVNGTQIGSTLDVTGDTMPDYSGVLGIGGYVQQYTDVIDGGYTDPFNGYIDEFRISKGVARWTANFTPETAPYPSSDIVISTDSVTATAASKVHVGLVNVPEFETLDVVAQDNEGTLQGILKRITNVTIRLIDSMGGVFGKSSSSTDAIPYDDETAPYTGWTRDLSFDEGDDQTATVYIKCDEPLPLEIAAINIDLEDE